MMNELMKQKTIKIGGQEYVLQMVPASWYLDLTDRCKDRNGNVITSRYMKELLEHVVVSPRCTIDDFTGSIYTLKNLVQEAENFILGEDLPVEKDDPKNEQKPEGSA